ncbi:hypothetical protein B0H13DRAFT_2344545 [Mycena leptocephala]|nr:hypothetical protein B0H13DRAFT_2344545 [Mycena leptocephala]
MHMPPVRRGNVCVLELISWYPKRSYCALHLPAVPLLLEHTDCHTTAAPISAPPACTSPAPLGLAPSRPPPMHIVLIYRPTTLLPRNASAAPPSYPPAPCPASTQTDIKQHVPSEMRRAEVSVAADPHPQRKPHAPRTSHTPQTSVRIPARVARASNPGREKGRLARRTHPTPPSLLFLPTDVQPAPRILPTTSSSSATSSAFLTRPAMAMRARATQT